MADTAAHLVDRVFPKVPVRQWVLSLPFALRYRLAYDSGLLRDVLHIFMQAVFSWLRRRARECCGIRKAKCGAVTFVQRFGGAINLNSGTSGATEPPMCFSNHLSLLKSSRL